MRLSKSKQLFHYQAVLMTPRYFGAATHYKRRFQFRLVNRVFQTLPGSMGLSCIMGNRGLSPAELQKRISLMYMSNANSVRAVHYVLGVWVNPHRERQTIPQGQTSQPAKISPHANGQSAPDQAALATFAGARGTTHRARPRRP